ncbi:pyridoxal phosphate homeostasis protein-like [Clavelina lepadiformis]|uniref:Pyridoxal phosphate homeostasis protein n=1 Tax=Clavelina lepadiformis TaxID=159417 RepID=A0ABP0F7Z3_CLALP
MVMKYKVMPEVVVDIAANLVGIRNGMREAVKRRPSSLPQRDPVLVAVSKTKSLAAVRQAYEAGQRHFGENYLKELVMKSTNPDMTVICPDIKWHYIGMFQKKMASVLMRVTNLYMLETLTASQEADAVNSRWKGTEPLRVMIQVNTSGEESKSGASPEKCVDVSIHIYNKCPNLKLSGLMTIGSAGHDYSTGPNPDFELLWKCRTDVCNALEIPMSDLDLSMGMSADYEEAIKAGSTSVRVGSNIFGARDYSQTSKT